MIAVAPDAVVGLLLLPVAMGAGIVMTVLVMVRNRRPERQRARERAEPPELPEHPG